MTSRSRVSKTQAAKHAPGPVYQLKVTLLEVEPPVWRRIVVPGTMTLLHAVIQKAMGWTDSRIKTKSVRSASVYPHFVVRS